MTNLKKGSKGNEVRMLQLYLVVVSDGIFGPKTQAAVKEFQKNNNLPVTGEVSSVEWTVIAKKLPTIKLGSTGDSVKIWQYFMNVEANGVFSTDLRAKTRTYQNVSGLTVDGVVGPKTWAKALITEEKTSSKTDTSNIPGKKNVKPNDYKQYDSRWGSVIYTQNNTYNRTQTIRNSGCGPSSMSDIVSTWWDKSVTPRTLAALSVANGYRTKSSGTDWGFFKFCAKKYGASKFVQTTSYATAEEAIKNGAYVVSSMKPGLWTKGGHFICWWWVDDTYVYVNDPASSASARAKAKKKLMKEQCKQYFIFYK